MELQELPGAEFILPGLEDLHKGNADTVGALLVAIASIRLTAAGLDIPSDRLMAEPELTLYDRLQHERDDAYPYYNALLSSLNSFCNALELFDVYNSSNASWYPDSGGHPPGRLRLPMLPEPASLDRIPSGTLGTSWE